MFETLWNAKRFLIKLKYQVHNQGSFTNLHLIKNNQSYLEMTTYQNKLMVQAILVLFKALKINLNEDFPKDPEILLLKKNFYPWEMKTYVHTKTYMAMS